MNRSLLFLLFIFALPVSAAETEVNITSAFNDKGIDGKLALPRTRDVPRKVVLLLHGYQGEMDEVGNLYKDLADQLSNQGIASLRINFTGEGERNGFVASSSYESRVGEAEAALAFLKARFPAAKLGVVGFSLGGLTTMGLIGRQPDAFESVVLWSAAHEMRLTRGDDEGFNNAVRSAITDGRGSYQDWAELTLTREFVTGFIGVSTAKHLAQFDGALLSIRGDKDFLPMLDPEWLALSPSDDRTFLLIGGADHIFNVLQDPQPNYSTRVLNETTAWFVRTL